MARPKRYDDSVVLESAKQLFLERGFEGTAVADIERRTGLSRSSLYSAFGTKRALFTLALQKYVADFIDPLLDPMEHGEPQMSAITDFYVRLAELFRGDLREPRRGCLAFNTFVDRPLRRDEAELLAATTLERVSSALLRCLRGEAKGRVSRTVLARRVGLLTTATTGLWLTARTDPEKAAALCDDVRAEVKAWA